MKNIIEKYCIDEYSTIREAMFKIDRNLIGGTFVINATNKVLGVITDGVIRRALLKGCTLEDKVNDIYINEFKFVNKETEKRKVKEIMLDYKIRQIPVLNEKGQMIDLYFIDDVVSYGDKDNYVFILAGGLGTRLRPLTENIPKPMLNIGEKPILQRIIESFKEYGFRNFIISLNYKGDIIEEYFGKGDRFGVNIEYVWEKKKLGTAGSIKLAEELINKPFIVINGDILTGLDFDKFINHHIENDNDITVGVRNYEVNIPYGVLLTENDKITFLKEKPTYNYYINSGIYSVNPDMIKHIPYEKSYNMTDLIEDIMKNEGNAGVYQVTEYWTDIGQHEDFKRANQEFHKHI
ncbi:nucleotidyltransferase family protein [Clostridium sp. DL1XJH146]